MSQMQALLVDYLPSISNLVASGIGSSLFKLAAAVDARQEGWTLDVVTSPPKAQLFQGSPVQRHVSTIMPEAALEGYDRLIFLGVPTPDHLIHPAHSDQLVEFSEADRRRYKITPHLAFWRAFVAQACTYPLPIPPAQFPLVIHPQERAAAARRLKQYERWIGLSIQAISPLKTYPRWPEVLDLILSSHRDIGVMLLGSDPHAGHADSRVLNLCGLTSIRELLAVIEQCEVIVGSDGLATNAAMALGRPTVTLFSVIAPEHVIDPHQATRAPAIPLVHTGCPLQFCYARLENYRFTACPLEPHRPIDAPVFCMRFEPIDIYASLLDLLSDRQ